MRFALVATFARTWDFHRLAHVLANVATVLTVLVGLAGAAEVRSHAPMRTLPEATRREREDGPALFVDAQRGDDAQAGSEAQPWKTLRHALRQLKPGDTLYLRGGTYYERPALSRSGT